MACSNIDMDMEQNQPATLSAPGSDPLMDKELWQSDLLPENWFCLLPDNVRSQVLKLLGRETIRVLLRVKEMRDLVLSEPECWRDLTLRIGSEKSGEMGALERVADFALKVTVEIVWLHPEQYLSYNYYYSIISRLPQFHNVVEMHCNTPCYSLSRPEPHCDVVLALAGHFEKIITLKVPYWFVGYEKSFYRALERKWVNLREVEIGVYKGDVADHELAHIVKGPCGFAAGVAESGRLVALRFSLDEESNRIFNIVRNTLMVLANGGHCCLRWLSISVRRTGADMGRLFKECLPFFTLNSLTTLDLVGFDCTDKTFTKRFLNVLASMTKLKVLVLHCRIRPQEQEMMTFWKSSRFQLKELGLTLSYVRCEAALDPLLLTIAEAQKDLEKVSIFYDCQCQMNKGPTLTGVSALENMPKMKGCQVKCSKRLENFHDHVPGRTCGPENDVYEVGGFADIVDDDYYLDD